MQQDKYTCNDTIQWWKSANADIHMTAVVMQYQLQLMTFTSDTTRTHCQSLVKLLQTKPTIHCECHVKVLHKFIVSSMFGG